MRDMTLVPYPDAHARIRNTLYTSDIIKTWYSRKREEIQHTNDVTQVLTNGSLPITKIRNYSSFITILASKVCDHVRNPNSRPSSRRQVEELGPLELMALVEEAVQATGCELSHYIRGYDG